MSKVSDYLVINPSRDKTTLGVRIIDEIGDYMKDEVLTVSTTLLAPNKPYTNKIKAIVQNYANTLEDDEKNQIIVSLSDITSGLTKLITALETTFTATQTAAETQFKTPATPPPFVYIPSTYFIALTAVFVLPLAIDMCTAFENFISIQYSSLGAG